MCVCVSGKPMQFARLDDIYIYIYCKYVLSKTRDKDLMVSFLSSFLFWWTGCGCRQFKNCPRSLLVQSKYRYFRRSFGHFEDVETT